MFCTECGNKLIGYEKFCNKCGNKILNRNEIIKEKTNSNESKQIISIDWKLEKERKTDLENKLAFNNLTTYWIIVNIAVFVLYCYNLNKLALWKYSPVGYAHVNPFVLLFTMILFLVTLIISFIIGIKRKAVKTWLVLLGIYVIVYIYVIF